MGLEAIDATFALISVSFALAVTYIEVSTMWRRSKGMAMLLLLFNVLAAFGTTCTWLGALYNARLMHLGLLMASAAGAIYAVCWLRDRWVRQQPTQHISTP